MSNDDYKAWLAGLKEGDEVVVQNVGFEHVFFVRVVDRATAHRIVVGGCEFNRKDGNRRGYTTWRSAYLRDPRDPETVECLRKQNEKREAGTLRREIEELCKRASLPKLRAAHAALAPTPDEGA